MVHYSCIGMHQQVSGYHTVVHACRFHPKAFTLLSLSAPSEAALDLSPITAAFARQARAATAAAAISVSIGSWHWRIVLQGVPLHVVSLADAHVRKVYERRLVLIRPDQQALTAHRSSHSARTYETYVRA
jgi:hypothetical protein